MEEGLFACGLGFAVIEFAVFILTIPGWLKFTTAWSVLIVSALLVGRAWGRVYRLGIHLATKIRANLRSAGWPARALCICIGGIGILEALVASAPLSGSDAMHYHFNTPLLEMAGPLRPRFDFTPSFLTGLAHLLIAFGLALGSDKIALGFICLGGLLTAVTLFAIARSLSSVGWALLAVFTFLVTPMVFWQITTSGSPDIWMGFYLGIAIIAANRALQAHDSHAAILAGVFAGSAAGIKYTGWVVSFAICGYLFVYLRPRKTAIWATFAALLAGCLPLVRNIVWTRDPFFPFLTRWLDPQRVDNYALDFMIGNTRSAGFSRAPLHLLSFPFALTIHGDNYGLGQYFGPAILAFAPLLFFVPWKNHIVRLAALAWALALVANAATAQMGRFLLPIYGIAIAVVFSGLYEAAKRQWRAVVYGCLATLALFGAFAFGSDLLYAKDFLPVALGMESKDAFLRRMAPDFQPESFVNQTLALRARNEGGVAMTFFGHPYYLRVPYVNGDPKTSWIMDPATCASSSELLRLLQEQNVRWVVKSPHYPESLAGPFQQLEAEGKLVPIASADFESLIGTSRIYGQRETATVTILQLAN